MGSVLEVLYLVPRRNEVKGPVAGNQVFSVYPSRWSRIGLGGVHTGGCYLRGWKGDSVKVPLLLSWVAPHRRQS